MNTVVLPKLPYGRSRHADPVPGAPALAVRAVSARYPGSSAAALTNADLTAPNGSQIALVGDNGSGKSTLLKVVAGLLFPTSGEISIYGNPVGACHHRVAYLPQRGDIDLNFPVSVGRFVLGGRFVHLGWLRRPSRKDKGIVASVLARLGVEDLAGRRIGALSGGQQQRALLARALAQESDLLLLDEPLTAVDAETRDRIQLVTEELRKAGKTLIVATHDLDNLYDEYDAVVCLCKGRTSPSDAGAR
ncbi:metal ABC transporter ATP-binding protein [Rubrobacter indicoceani]|uniref:metal ABC transporter ATP-binding protein n=1 Tax=Rubrobacter indicoceani TaxID=2051957 RepID=UPI000E5B74D1|nr:metal ABC transporter ATP-binding protein [Rubrobacter indicoceani]